MSRMLGKSTVSGRQLPQKWPPHRENIARAMTETVLVALPGVGHELM